jgi:hypothetical protein
MVARLGVQQVGWSTMNRPVWLSWGSREILVGSSDANALTPTSVHIPSRRASGVPLTHFLHVPGETLGLVRAAAASSSLAC